MNIVIIVILKFSNIWISCESISADCFSSHFSVKSWLVCLVILYYILGIIDENVGDNLSRYWISYSKENLFMLPAGNQVSTDCLNSTSAKGNSPGLQPLWGLIYFRLTFSLGSSPFRSHWKPQSSLFLASQLCKFWKLCSAFLASKLKLSASFSNHYHQEGLSEKS